MKKLNEEDKEEVGYYNREEKPRQIFKMRRPIDQKYNLNFKAFPRFLDECDSYVIAEEYFT